MYKNMANNKVIQLLVVVAILIEAGLSTTTDEALCSEIGPVEELSLQENGDQLVATWTAPADARLCTLSYILAYNDGTGTHLTASNDTIFSFGYRSCDGAEVTVTAHTALGLASAATHATCKKQVSELGHVVNLKIVKLQDILMISWEAPQNADEFGPLVYLVKYVDLISYVANTMYVIQISDLAKCVQTVFTVTPLSSSTNGKDASIDYIIDLGPVRNVQFSQIKDRLKITWDGPQNADNCGQIFYIIEYNGVSNILENPQFDKDIANIGYCFEVIYKITAVSNLAVQTHSIEEAYTARLGPVQNVLFTQSGNMLNEISWDRPQNAERCGYIFYIIEFSGKTYVREYPYLVRPPVESCMEVVFKITPVSSLSVGHSVEKTYTTPCRGIGGV